MFPPSPSNHHQGQRSIVAEAEHLNCLLPVSTFQNCTVISQSGVSALEGSRRAPNWGGEALKTGIRFGFGGFLLPKNKEKKETDTKKTTEKKIKSGEEREK